MADRTHVDVAFWGGVVPGNVSALAELAAFGVPGCKCFLCPSGVDEFPHVGRAELELALPVLRDLGLTLLVHAEAPLQLLAAEEQLLAENADPRRYTTYLKSRPNAAEDAAVAMVIELSEKYAAPAHIVHLSSATALPLLRAAQARGVPITAETCLHYLTFAAEEVPDGDTQYKCAPPIREAANREALWEGLGSGIGQVVSDHSPCAPQLKRTETGDFMAAWGGIAGLQLGLSVLWTEVQKRGLGLAQMYAWNALAPAKLAGLTHRKGQLRRGFDADIVIWDDHTSFVVEAADIRHRHKLTPYAGRTLSGVVEQTWVGGKLAFSRKSGLASRPVGSFISVH